MTTKFLRTTWIIKNLITTSSDKMVYISPTSFDPVGMKTFCFLWEEDPMGQKYIFDPAEDTEAESVAVPASPSGYFDIVTASSLPCLLSGISWKKKATHP